MSPEQAIEVPISKKIILIPLLVIVAFTLVGFGCIDLYLRKTALRRYEKDLITLAHSGAQFIGVLGRNPDWTDYDTVADSFAHNSRLRVTITDGNGVVLGDSRLSVDEIRHLESFTDRPEIMEARASVQGIALRHSRISGIRLLYAAVRFENAERQGYFRIAVPLNELEQDLKRQRHILGAFCFTALCIAIGLSFLASRYLVVIITKGKAFLEHQVVKRTREIEILQNFGTQLTACNSMAEILEAISLVSSILLPRYSGSLALFRPSKDKLEIIKSWKDQWRGEAIYSPDQCWALRAGKPYVGNKDIGNLTCAHSPDPEGKLYCIPLVAQGETHGVLHFSCPLDTEWTTTELQMASAIAEHTSLTLANLQLRESLRQQAIRDSLTGLYNRRYLLETMEHELSRALRQKSKLGVIMVDLDHFKTFNDENGHDIGDFILSEFGRLVRLVIREEDIACRYGGEEFIILFPETDREGTYQAGRKLGAKIREHSFLFQNRSYGPITISIGAAVFPDNGNTTELLLKEADNALYEAKKAGRDRTVMASLPHN